MRVSHGEDVGLRTPAPLLPIPRRYQYQPNAVGPSIVDFGLDSEGYDNWRSLIISAFRRQDFQSVLISTTGS